MGEASTIPVAPISPAKKKTPSPWLPWYTYGVAAMGAIFLIFALVQLPEDWPGLLVFALLAALVELINTEMYTSSRSRVSVSSVIGIAAIMLFGPLAGAVVHVANGFMTAVTTSIRSRHRKVERRRVSALSRALFNTGMFITSASVAGTAYYLVGGRTGNVMQVSNLIPLLVAATVDVLMNLGLLIGVITLQTGRPISELWNEDFQWAAPIAIAGNIFGAVLALAYEMFAYLGLTVFMLPILATNYSFRLYVNNSKGYIEKLKEMNEELDEVNLGLLETLGAVIDAYDMFTYGHSTQVAVYASALAEKMNLPLEERSIIVKAALVHDLGKVAVMDSIISKPGALTDEEFQQIRRHPEIGAQIVSRMKGFKDLVDLVRHHHERWDGKGYPDGLAGEQIVRGARILAMADSLDAMFSTRPYRPARSYQEILAEVARCSGTQFDPEVARAFFALAEEKGPEFFINSATNVDQVLHEGNLEDLGKFDRYLKNNIKTGG